MKATLSFSLDWVSCSVWMGRDTLGLIGLSACVPRLVAWQIEDEQYIPVFREELKDKTRLEV